MKAKDVMSRPVVEIFESATVQHAAQMMSAHRTGILVVVAEEDGRLRGVVTDRDLLMRCVAAGQDPTSVTVKECISGPDSPGGQIVMVSPEEDLEEVTATMRRTGVHRALVSQDGHRVIGLVSFDEIALDLKRYLDEFLSLASRYHRP
jgi:CBS domain-containing protein